MRSIYWEKKVSQITEIIEQGYENLFAIQVYKEKLLDIICGVALNDDTAKSILNMGDVRKTIMKPLEIYY